MSKRDYYETLGVNKNASNGELKSAFRQLARKYHPDVSKEPDAEERFKEINEAYAVLSDEEKRAAYNRFGHAGLNGMGGMPDFNSMDLGDLFEELFGFGFGGSRSRGRQSRNRPRKGQNLQTSVNLSFEEAVFGIEKEISISRDEVCTHCNGEKAEPGSTPIHCTTCNGVGEVRQARQTLFGSMVQVTSCPTCNGAGTTIEKPCKQCNGRGVERKSSKKTVEIPGGVDTGTQIRLSGEGQPGIFGGPKGDLYVIVKVKKHQFFQRRDYDILLNLDINIAQATLGADVEIPSVDGPTNLQIPSGTQPGKIFQIKGKGIPHLRTQRRGDQLVIINVVIPKKVSDEQRELLETLAVSLGSEVHPQERSIFDSVRDFFGG